MRSKFLFLLLLAMASTALEAQKVTEYLRNNAVRIADPEVLPDSVYGLLNPFQIVMLGEMHGSNEPAQFARRLAELYLQKGDSVQVGFEIPADQMREFLSLHTDSSIAGSSFFAHPRSLDGRASNAWAGAIAQILKYSNARIFFFDMNAGDGKVYERDSLMALKIRQQYLLHPRWKMITLSGNAHNMLPKSGQYGSSSMASVLRRDQAIPANLKICTLNHYYSKGSCRADFGNGLEEKQFENPASEYDTALNVEEYLVLVASTSTYPYSGFYYSKYITPAKMACEK